MFVEKIGKEYYLCRKRKSSLKHPGKTKKTYNHFLVKIYSTGKKYYYGMIPNKSVIYFPKKFIGKRIRFRIELI